MTMIAPSILSADFANLERDIRDIRENGGDWVHVDVMDGLFVPNITIGIPVVEALNSVTDLPLDVHLMIVEPLRYVERFADAGADWITVHVEADTEENTLEALRRIRAKGCRPGISLNPDTPAEAILPFLPYCDLVLVMTVQPGFGAQKFRGDVMPKLQTIREKIESINPGCLISVDGGVNPATAPICRENGANVLVTGSCYFGSRDRKALLNTLRGE